MLSRALSLSARHATRNVKSESSQIRACSATINPHLTKVSFMRPSVRNFANNAREAYQEEMREKNRKVLIYASALVVGVFGVTYASVPLYKVFCQMTGFGGTTQRADEEALDRLKPVEDAKPIRVHFSSGSHSHMPWKFYPQQTDLVLVPGETALAFYTAKNPTDEAITGVATYNVYPPKAGLYFNKIQCFCFEEQRLKAGEEIDMPVFFFIDPEMLDDPTMDGVNQISLSYTFFRTEDFEEDQIENAKIVAARKEMEKKKAVTASK